MSTINPTSTTDRRRSTGASAAVLVMALLLGVATLLLVRPRYALVDDYVQQLYVSGRLMGCGVCRLMPYTLSLISFPESMLYQAFPMVPWYVLVLLALIVVSFWVCGTSVLRSRLSNRMAACACLVLAALEACSAMYLTYTVVAFLATSAGLALLVVRASFGREGLRGSDVLGLALVTLGFALRPESGLGSFVVFSPFAAYVLVRNRHATALLRGLAAIALVAAVFLAGRAAYDATPGWERYNDYLDNGRSALDYPELTADELREIDPSITDASASVLNKWIFIQSDPFSVEFFERLGSARAHVSVEYLLSALKAKTTWLALGFVVLIGMAGMALMADVRGSRSTRACLLAICGMALLSCLVFALRARVRLHVVYPLVVSALMAVLACCHAPTTRQGSHFAPEKQRGQDMRPSMRTAFLALVAFACVAATVGFWRFAVQPQSIAGEGELSQSYDAYLRQADGVTIQGSAQTAFIAHDALSFEKGSYPENALVPGGWMVYTGPWQSWLDAQGLTGDDTLEQLTQHNDMALVTSEDTAETIRAFVEERLGQPVEKHSERTLGSSSTLHVWRYSLV